MLGVPAVEMGWLISLFTGPVINGLLDAYRAKLGAENTRDNLAVDLAKKEIEAEIAARAEGTKMMVAEQGRWWTAMPRAIVCWSFAVYIAKVVIWDTVLEQGVTNPLGGSVAEWAGMVMLTWFGGRSIEKVATIFARRR